MLNPKKPIVKLLYKAPLAVSEIAARACYNSFEQSENECVRNKEIDLINNSKLLDKLVWNYHHESVIEHTVVSYWIENIPRNVVIELNRHRLFSTSQKSTRYTIDELINAYLYVREHLESDKFDKVVAKNIAETNPRMVNVITDYLWNALEALDIEEPLFINLKGNKKKKQNDRVKFILPECWLTEGVWTANLRELKHFFKLRISDAAYPLMKAVAEEMYEVLPQNVKRLVRR